MPERIHAPELSGATGWLNVDAPISLRSLRGQVVILDFWTYCCINCQHVLPILRDLEDRHRSDPLVVIGVHSAKFDGEKDDQQILAAMARGGVQHPVAVDSEMAIWKAFAIRSWPTLVILRPDGTLAAVAPGEPDPETLEAFIQGQLAEARANGTLAAGPTPLVPHRAPRDAGHTLSFPGKVAVAPGGGLVAVADSGHHRVLVLDAQGAVLGTIGSGLRGAREGSFAEAALDDPQGMAFVGERLYITDARSHLVYEADLAAQRIKRVAGTGTLGLLPLTVSGPALETALRSPWDVVGRAGELFIALAGSHQLARLDLVSGVVEPLSGNGREALIDGKGLDTALAQPSGLALQGDLLYVADSESSGVRILDLHSRKLFTLVGGPGLFDFGDAVGPLRPGMLQHPLAVAATRADGLLVADTYNGKIKRFSPDGMRLEPFFEGAADSALSQPAGLAVLPSGEVLVADTNHHRLVKISADGAQAFELEIAGAPVPLRGVAVADAVRAVDGSPAAGALPAQAGGAAAGWFTALLQAPPGVGFAPGEAVLTLELLPPAGFELAAGAPWTAALEISRRSDLARLEPEFLRGQATGGAREALVFHVRSTHAEDVESELLVQIRSVVCDARDHAACHPVRNSFRVPLRLLVQGQSAVAFALPLEVQA